MKTKHLTIKIRPLAEGLQEFARVVRDIQRGRPPKALLDTLAFESLDAMRKVLTAKRIALLQTIRHERPASVYALAKTTGRDLRNVQDDVAMLARLGLVSLSPGKHARAGVSPRVKYDNLRVDIPLADPELFRGALRMPRGGKSGT